MRTLSPQERVLKVLNVEEPDMIPHFENVDPKVINSILPNGSYDDFVDYMGFDATGNFDKIHSWSYEEVDAAKKVFRDQWGALVQFSSERLGHPIKPAIISESDLENYIPPDPDEEWRYSRIKEILKRYKNHRAVYAHATDVFNIASDSLLGTENYFEAMITKPELVTMVNEIVLNYNLRYIKNCLELGIDFFYVTGDFAMTKGPMVSPKHTEKFLTAPLKKQVELAHRMNAPVLKHTDGNIWKIFDLIIDTGINGIHPIDPLAGMDIGEVKKKYGDRLCLAGGVNCASTLSWGTIDDVRQEVRSCIKAAGYGGGFICRSSNSIHSGVKPENYLAMVAAIREYGKYPLKLD